MMMTMMTEVFRALLPAAVATASMDAPTVQPGGTAGLFADEARAVAGAVDKRRDEFAAGRACAREALGRIGVAPVSIPTGSSREPLWPSGIVGSLTHCEGLVAAAVARTTDICAVGIDAEPNEPLPDGVAPVVMSREEAEQLAALPAAAGVAWDRLLFSAKESVYKVWFPLMGTWLDFSDAVVRIDPEAGTFSARLLVPGPEIDGTRLEVLRGRWELVGPHVITALTLQGDG